MYDVYTNRRNNNKKWLIVGIGGIVVIGIMIGVFFFLSGNNNEKTLKNYFENIEDRKYEDVYALLDEESQHQYSKDNFITRNQNIYEGIQASDFDLSINEEEDNQIKYTLKMKTAAGEISFDNTVDFKDGKIVWDDSFIFPELKDGYKVRVSETEALRGRILDRNGKELATEGNAYSVGLVRGKLNGENDYEKLAELLGLSKESIQKTMSAKWIKDDSFVPLKTVSSKDEKLETNLLAIPGVKLTTTKVRSYPYGKATAHLIGYMQKVTAEDLEKHKNEGYSETSYIGRSGIEASYEKELKGTNGARITILDTTGERVTTIANAEKQDGQDITLTLDIDLQLDLYNQFKDEESASVAMNPKTGEVLALVSTPTFDSNDFILGMSTKTWNALNNDQAQPLYNRFKASWVPGSTMKPITGAIGLETKTLDPRKNFGSEMKWQKDSSWGSYHVTTVHAGSGNLKSALVASDNVYFAKAALEIGKDNLIKGYKAFKIGEDIPFEVSLNKSQYTSDKFDDEIQIADSGYGQGQVLMNPIQMAAIYGSFVNDGNVMTPYVVKDTGSKVWIEKAVSSETAKTIKEDLISVISDPQGIIHSFYDKNITYAGKTGTAEIKASQDDTTGTELGWFTVMSADEHKPIVISTMVEDVKNRGGSHYVANKTKKPIENYIKK